MTTTTAHESFVIERHYPASPERVFAAWSDPSAKARWFAGPNEWIEYERGFDFRVGGSEHLKGKHPSGVVSTYDSRYMDIVKDRRIVCVYDMHLDDKRISVSLATIELEPAGTGTRLRYTEQGAFLDGYDDAGSRERGTQGLFDQLERHLAR